MSIIGIGGKMGFKYGLTNPNSRFALSFMPYAGYSKGQKVSNLSLYGSVASEHFGISSNNTSFEMNLPMSYYISKDFSILFGLTLTKNFHTASTTYYNSDNSEHHKYHNQYFSSGTTLGIRWIQIYHEMRINHVDDHFDFYYGVALKHKAKLRKE